MTKLNERSKITVRWTANPADMGYDGQSSDWLGQRGETMGVRRALGFANELSQKIGHGTNRLIEYKNNGRAVTVDEIQAAVGF